jgi:uncharacterized protein
MNCRICNKPVQPAYKPFCSRHCADVDLAQWLRGAYVTSRPLTEQDLDDNALDTHRSDDLASKQ